MDKKEKITVIKAIIFDYGGVISPKGTLGNISSWYAKKYNCDRDHFIKIIDTYWNAAKLNNLSSKDFWEHISTELNRDTKILRKELIHLIRPDENMIALIQKLKRIYTIALLSNHVEDWLEEHLKEDKLKKIFSPIVTSYNTGFAKPDKKIFDIMKKKLQLDFEECLFIDDKEKNIDAATSLGMKTILFENYTSLCKKLIQMDIVWES